MCDMTHGQPILLNTKVQIGLCHIPHGSPCPLDRVQTQELISLISFLFLWGLWTFRPLGLWAFSCGFFWLFWTGSLSLSISSWKHSLPDFEATAVYSWFTSYLCCQTTHHTVLKSLFVRDTVSCIWLLYQFLLKKFFFMDPLPPIMLTWNIFFLPYHLSMYKHKTGLKKKFLLLLL